MARVVAVRKENVKFEGTVTYCFRDDRCDEFEVLENTNLVDGIGGVTWVWKLSIHTVTAILSLIVFSHILLLQDGALILSQVVELMSKDAGRETHVVEVGCGTGLCGIVAAKLGYKSTITDRSADLAKLNVDMVKQQMQASSTSPVEMDAAVYDMPWESSHASAGNRDTVTDVDGEEPVVSVRSVLNLRGKVDLVVGAEITCLRKQQGLLVDTVLQLTASNPNAIALFSFDGPPQPNGCLYEQDMIERMAAVGFSHSVVYVAGCVWVTEHFVQQSGSKASEEQGNQLPVHKVSKAHLIDRTEEHRGASQRLHFPIASSRGTSCKTSSRGAKEATWVASPDADSVPIPADSMDRLGLPPQPPASSSAESKQGQSSAANRVTTSEEGLHHIIAFYRPAATRTCHRCHQQFFAHADFNPAHACRYHAGYFVCRWHPAETKCSIDGQGDGLGYYGNGQENYAAEFWDCCGSESKSASGCCAASHEPYR